MAATSAEVLAWNMHMALKTLSVIGNRTTQGSIKFSSRGSLGRRLADPLSVRMSEASAHKGHGLVSRGEAHGAPAVPAQGCPPTDDGAEGLT